MPRSQCDDSPRIETTAQVATETRIAPAMHPDCVIDEIRPVDDRFEVHLAECAGCQAYVAQMRALVDELGRLPEVELPPALETELLTAFRDWSSDRS